jgi:probable rRNA maturation factor
LAIEVIVTDEQRDHAVDTTRLSALAKATIAEMGLSGEVELALAFVDAARITTLNEELLGHVGPTDVLSFPIEDAPLNEGTSTELPLLLGDVVICPAVAAANAPEHAGSYEDELSLLVVHGILHLLGMDHEDDAEAEEMERRERELLARHGALGAQ